MRLNVAHRFRAQGFAQPRLSFVQSCIGSARSRVALRAGLALLCLAAPIATLQAQSFLVGSAPHAELPDAPSFVQAAQASPASAVILGGVTDLSSALVPGALIKLEAETAGTTPRALHSDSSGRFSFNALPAGVYHLTIYAPGLQRYTSKPLTLAAGERLELPTVALAIADASVSVTVGGNSTEVAEAELHQEEQQRTLGIFPQFHTSYIWNAAPLSSKQKFKLAGHVLGDPVSLIGFALTAEIETNADTFPQWGRDAPSYGKRFGAAVGDSLFSRGLDSAFFPALFHQDPRYFYMGPSQPTRKRLLHAISSGIICRGDNGKLQPNFSHIVGNASAGAISSLYHPASDGPGKLALDNSALRLGFDGLDGVLREFVFSHITRHKPTYAIGEPANQP